MSVPEKIKTGDYLILKSFISYTKLKPTAEEPFKENIKDVGHQITVVERTDNRSEDVYGDVNLFSTGLSFKAPKHYHIEILEHPDLHKTGYTLIGGPRILNPGDDQEVVLPLYKYKEVEDLELPFRAALIVLRQTEYSTIASESYTREEEKFYEERKPMGRGKQTKLGSTPSSKPSKMSRGSNHMF